MLMRTALRSRFLLLPFMLPDITQPSDKNVLSLQECIRLYTGLRLYERGAFLPFAPCCTILKSR